MSNAVAFGSSSAQSYGSYGASIPPDGMAMVSDWAAVFATVVETSERAVQANSYAVYEQNKYVSEQLGKMNQYTDAKSELTKLIGKFKPDASANDKIKDVDGYDGDGSKTLDELNKILGALKFPAMSGESTKADLDALLVSLNGKSDTLSGEQGLQSSKLNMYMGKIQASLQMQANVTKAEGTAEMAFARNSGPL